MDEVLVRGLTRQLKILNTWIAVVGGFILVALIICIILVVKVFMFVQDTKEQVSNLQQKAQSSLDVKKQLCETDRIGSLLNNRSEFCSQ